MSDFDDVGRPARRRERLGARRVQCNLVRIIGETVGATGMPLAHTDIERIAADIAPAMLALPYSSRVDSDPLDKSTIVLTRRERQVIIGIALGLQSSEIAAHLILSEHSVRTHRRTAYKALGVSTAGHAVAVALKYGIITASDISAV